MIAAFVVEKVMVWLVGSLLVGATAATDGSAYRGPDPWPQPEGTPSTFTDENGEPLSPLELWNASFEEPFFSEEEMAREKAVALIPVGFNEEVHRLPEFGGLYIAREPLATMVVNVVGNDRTSFEALAKTYGANELVEFREVRYTEAELRRLQDEVSNDWEYWRGEGVELSRVGADSISNRVVIGITDWSPQIHLRMLQRYGLRIAVVEEQPGTWD